MVPDGPPKHTADELSKIDFTEGDLWLRPDKVSINRDYVSKKGNPFLLIAYSVGGARYFEFVSKTVTFSSMPSKITTRDRQFAKLLGFEPKNGVPYPIEGLRIKVRKEGQFTNVKRVELSR